MATGTRVCKVCGKTYPYCKTVVRPDVFRWQDVACSFEHGEQYLAEVLASRSIESNFAVASEVKPHNEEVKTEDAPVIKKRTRTRKVIAEE